MSSRTARALKVSNGVDKGLSHEDEGTLVTIGGAGCREESGSGSNLVLEEEIRECSRADGGTKADKALML